MLHPYLATVLFQWQLQVDPYDPSLPLISTYLYIYFYWTCSCSKEIWNTARWILSNTITYWISYCVYDRRIKYKEIPQMRGKWMSCHLHVVRKPHERILVRLLKAKFAPLSSVTIKQDSICPTQGHMFDSMFFFLPQENTCPLPDATYPRGTSCSCLRQIKYETYHWDWF